MENFRVFGKIGEGAHGTVFHAEEIKTGQKVALKKLSLKRLEDGIPIQIFREIRTLQHCSESKEPGSECILRLRSYFAAGSAVVLATDFMLGDLGEIIRNWENPLSEAQSKSYSLQLLRGLAFIHSQNIIHRDLKPSNLLISPTRRLKIADFGLARLQDDVRPMSHQVATRWYRAPELLYGARRYNYAVDMWSAGTIIGELLTFSPLFPGHSDIEQLWCVIRILGTPTEETWPQLPSLPDYKKIQFAETKAQDMHEFLCDAPIDGVNLLKELLIYNADKRLSASECLRHEYFYNKPLPSHHSELPLPVTKDRKIRDEIADFDRPFIDQFESFPKVYVPDFD